MRIIFSTGDLLQILPILCFIIEAILKEGEDISTKWFIGKFDYY
jgi:hypothetical protein